MLLAKMAVKTSSGVKTDFDGKINNTSITEGNNIAMESRTHGQIWRLEKDMSGLGHIRGMEVVVVGNVPEVVVLQKQQKVDQVFSVDSESVDDVSLLAVKV